ncbi:MAG: transcription-repair coupling factor, partial [Desulfobacterales bacterium]
MNQNQEKISLKYLFDTSPYKDCDVICTGLSGSEKAYFVNRLYMKHRAPVVVVTSSTKEAEICLEDLDFFTERPSPPPIYFPPYNITPFKYLSYHNETAAKRIRSLYQLIVGDVPPMVVTTISALMQRILPKQELCDYAELVMIEEDIDRDRLVDKLISSGYD